MKIDNSYRYDSTTEQWYITIHNPRWKKERTFFIDDRDIELIRKHIWSLKIESQRFYAICTCHNVAVNRMIMDAQDNDIIGYINQNTLDNTRKNLKFYTPKKVVTKSRIQKKKFDIPVKGVEFKKGKWEARIRNNGRWVYLGRHDILYDAICCRIRHEYLLFGEDTPNYRKVLKTIPRYFLVKWLPEIYSNLAEEFIGSEIYRAHYKQRKVSLKHVRAMTKAGQPS